MGRQRPGRLAPPDEAPRGGRAGGHVSEAITAAHETAARHLAPSGKPWSSLSRAGRIVRASPWPKREDLDTVQRITREQARKYAFDWRGRAAAARRARRERSRSRPTTPAPATSRRRRTRPSRRSGPGFDRVPPLANPIGGPVCVEGAERGDTLVVAHRGDRGRRLLLDRRRPAARPARRIDALAGAVERLHDQDLPPHARARAARRATARCTSAIGSRWPITPFIGTLGVAPDREVTTSLDGQGEWGGNLDIRDVAPGNRILPAGLPPGRAVLPGRRPRQPGRHRVHRHRRRDEGDRAAAARPDQGQAHPLDAHREARRRSSRCTPYRPLEVAVETATIHLMDWLITDYGFTPTDAYCLVSTCPDFRINVYQMCKIAQAELRRRGGDPEAVSARPARVSGRARSAPRPRRKEDAPLLLGRRPLPRRHAPRGTLRTSAWCGAPTPTRASAAIDTRDARAMPGVRRGVERRRSARGRARPIPAGVRGRAQGPAATRRACSPATSCATWASRWPSWSPTIRIAWPTRWSASPSTTSPCPPVTTPEAAARGSETRLHADWPDNAAVVARGSGRRRRAGASPPPTWS